MKFFGEPPPRMKTLEVEPLDFAHLAGTAIDRFQHNEDPMAVDKPSDGIRKFYADGRKLEKYAETLVSKAA